LRPGLYPRAVLAFGVLSVVLGIALLVKTASIGGGSVGYLLGVLFVGLGIGRIYLLRRR
jgi:uncharacterized membrane protein HdeD (DUF308 family)